MLTTPLLVASLLGTAAATLINFDDITAAQFAVVPVGVYNGLMHQGFVAINSNTALFGGQVLGLRAQSNRNVAGTDPALVNRFGPPALLAHYKTSTTSFFDLQSFYFGCVPV
ncbi:hypothetical protein LTR09_003223 [Extremus antarcticus]|uniref:Uncharacterized protein n=1 Tax=Extremus antarcticus TaxID=702011 RepID=A0AAJ0GEI4_9PEZI|nr:hypothetical protein LTR09_003223 [Extremus antarcticus]